MSKPSILFSLNSNIIRYEEFEEPPTSSADSQKQPTVARDGFGHATAHDWQAYRAFAKVFDDGTQTFFW